MRLEPLVRASRVTGRRETGLRPTRGMFRGTRRRVSPAATSIRSVARVPSANFSGQKGVRRVHEGHSRP